MVLIPPDGKCDVDSVLEDFKDNTVEYVSEYFGNSEETARRIVDFDEVLDDMKDTL